MSESRDMKALVRSKYHEIAQSENPKSGCCDAAGAEVYNIMNEDYQTLEGYTEDADMGLGCGIPTQFAEIKKGQTVLDLGSGAGNDCFVARAAVGLEGKVIGVDFTPAMITKARINADKLQFNNVEFREGDIDDLPVAEESIDVVISNCVLNLLPNKDKVFHEIFKVLKPQRYFCISDVVTKGHLPESIKNAAEMYAGCVSGAISKPDYIAHIIDAGFTDIAIVKEKEIIIPDPILSNYLSTEEINQFRASGAAIKSITVVAKKTALACSSNSGCC